MLEIFKGTKDILPQKAGEELSKLVLEKKGPVLLLLSGGSSLALLEHVNKAVFSAKLTLAVLDERYSTDAAVNNFSLLRETGFFSKAIAEGASFISTAIEKGVGHGAAAEKFERSLRVWRQNNPSGSIIITIGIGADGHTAGMMPYPENKKEFEYLFERDNWVTSYDAHDKDRFPLRVTTTMTFLRIQVDAAVAYITGEEKKDAYRKILAKTDYNKVPARIIAELKRAFIFTNIEA
jgi:6-phosphogluconolactonase/glucosamine-6-phosphate isomerase/deaminase